MINQNILRPIVLAGAVLLLLWGVKGALSRPLPGARTSTSQGSLPPTDQPDWEESLPPSPLTGLAPSASQADPKALPTDLSRSETLRVDQRELRLELVGGSSPAQYKDATLYQLRLLRVWEENELLQTISFEAPYFQGTQGSMWTESPDFGYRSEEMNFDGYPDFSVATNLWGETGESGAFSFHFLWSAKNTCFIPAPELDALPYTAFEEEGGLVSSSRTTQEGKQELREETAYFYREGRLERASRHETVLDREQDLRIEESFQPEGEGWKSVSREEYPLPPEEDNLVQ